MSEENDWSIDQIRQSIHTLNENLLMIAYQLYVSSATQQGLQQYANEKTFFSEFKNLENAKEQEE